MGDPHYTPSGAPTEGSNGDSSDVRAEFGLIEAGIEVLNNYPAQLYFEDANAAADQRYITVPWQCTIERIWAINEFPNGTTDTVLTAKIGGTAVTNGAITFLSTDVIATVRNTIPTGANAVTEGGAIEIETDGAGSTVMPVTITMLLKRT